MPSNPSEVSEARRRFLAYFAGAGLSSTLLPGALWAQANPPASNTPSTVTELVKICFIPDAIWRTPVERIPYRCIPKTMVVHSSMEIQPEQPDDSIPRSRAPWFG